MQLIKPHQQVSSLNISPAEQKLPSQAWHRKLDC